MVAMRDAQNEQNLNGDFVGQEEAVAPIQVPQKPLPAPGRKMSFREALKSSIKRNHEIYKRLD